MGKYSISPLIDPYELLQEKWNDNISSYLPVEFGDIYSYLIEKTWSVHQGEIQAYMYKSLDALNLGMCIIINVCRSDICFQVLRLI